MKLKPLRYYVEASHPFSEKFDTRPKNIHLSPRDKCGTMLLGVVKYDIRVIVLFNTRNRCELPEVISDTIRNNL
jgi:hypothetical protein